MCNLSDAIEERGIRRGILIGQEQEKELGIRNLIEAYKECGLTEEVTSAKVANKYGLEKDVIKIYMEKCWV